MCYHPINVRQADGRYMKCKCGKCLECLTEQRNAWVIRMTEELKTHHQKGVFFTLTYSDDNIPKNFLVYETSITDTPKLYESESDYNYVPPVGYRCGRAGRKTHADPVDKVLKQFYKDYEIHDVSIDNNFNKYKEDYERAMEEIYASGMEEHASCPEAPTPWVATDFSDWLNAADFADTPYRNNNAYDSGLSTELLDYGQETDYQSRPTLQVVQDNDQRGTDKGTDMVADLRATDRCSADDKGYGQDDERITPYAVLAFNSVRQKDLQDWLKRGRARLTKQGKNFTYFITSEYGPRTLRPHYHGCLFGVNVDDVRFMFDDWRARFGRRIKFDNINGTAGCSYCAKYCAKGFYEHPLCSRDFFYMKNRKPLETGDDTLDELMNKLEFTEYHSKHYERCVEFFGIDAPIVQPTFKLVSKGLGIEYCSRMKTYFHLDEFEEKISITKLGQEYEREFNEFMDEIQRFYHYTNEKGFTFNMPQYYRTKMFSDTLRLAYTNYVRSQYDKLYYEQLRQLQAEQPTRKAAEILLDMEKAQRRQKISQLEKKLENTERYFNRSKL